MCRFCFGDAADFGFGSAIKFADVDDRPCAAAAAAEGAGAGAYGAGLPQFRCPPATKPQNPKAATGGFAAGVDPRGKAKAAAVPAVAAAKPGADAAAGWWRR